MIDAHFHSWLLSRGDYGWLTPALPAIYRDVSIADWQAQASAHNVKAGVLVQAAPTEAETQWLLAQVLQFPLALCWPVWWVWLPLALRQPSQATQQQPQPPTREQPRA